MKTGANDPGLAASEGEALGREAGKVVESPIVIQAEDSESGVAAEYEFLDSLFGPGDTGWSFVRQRLFILPDGRKEDAVTIRLADGSVREIRFDITAFCGRFSD